MTDRQRDKQKCQINIVRHITRDKYIVKIVIIQNRPIVLIYVTNFMFSVIVSIQQLQ